MSHTHGPAVIGSSRVRLGTSGDGETRINLNAAEAVEDADVFATGLDGNVHVSGGGAPTVYDARGSAATGGPLVNVHHLGSSNASDDRLYAGARDATLTAGGGGDALVGGEGDEGHRGRGSALGDRRGGAAERRGRR